MAFAGARAAGCPWSRATDRGRRASGVLGTVLRDHGGPARRPESLREVRAFRHALRAEKQPILGSGQRAGWLGGSGYMSDTLGLLSCWLGSNDVRLRARGRAGARDAVSARTCRTDSSAPLGQPLWQGARGSMADDPCCCAGLPGPLTGRGRGIASVKSVARSRSRSQRVAIQTLPLLRGWQPRCARYAQSQRSCTRGGARGGRRARLNLMRPCRLAPKSAEPNTYSEPMSGTKHIREPRVNQSSTDRRRSGCYSPPNRCRLKMRGHAARAAAPLVGYRVNRRDT